MHPIDPNEGTGQRIGRFQHFVTRNWEDRTAVRVRVVVKAIALFGTRLGEFEGE